MTSKKSFWKHCKTEADRQRHIFGICAVAQMMVMLFFINAVLMNYKETVITNTGESLKEWMCFYQTKLMWNLSGWQGGLLFVSLLLGFVCALQSYSWVNHASQIDFYGALPITKSQRFWSINFVETTAFIFGLGLAEVMANLLIAVNGLWCKEMLWMSLMGLAAGLLVFCAVYALTLIAVFLTGNSLLATLGGIFLLLVENIIYFLHNAYAELFYQSMYHFGAQSRRIPFGITPLSGVVKITSVVNAWNDGTIDWSVQGKPVFMGMIMLLIQAVVFFALSYLLYKKRPALHGGKQMIYDWTKPIIKVSILVVGALGIGWFGFLTDSFNKTTCFTMILIGLLLVQVVVQSLMDGNIRYCFRGWKSFLIGVLITFIACGFYVGDWRGYDSKIPDAKELEYVSWVVEGQENEGILKNDGSVVTSVYDLIEEREFSDAQNIEALRSMLMKAKEEHANHRISLENEGGYMREVLCLHVKFQKKDGTTQYRSYQLEKDRLDEFQREVVQNPSYRKEVNVVSSQGVKQVLAQGGTVRVSYQNQILSDNEYVDSERESVKQLVELAEKTYLNRRGETEWEEPVIGVLKVEIKGENQSGYYSGILIPVYEADKEMVKELDERNWLDDGETADPDVVVDAVEVMVRVDENRVLSETFSVNDSVAQDILEKVIINKEFEYGTIHQAYQDNAYDVTIYTKDGDCYNGYFAKDEIPSSLISYFEKRVNKNC